MKQLRVWVTELKRRYKNDVFNRTLWNIVIFHTFFVLVMVIVFGVILYYTKLNIFTTLNEMLQIILSGGTVNANIIDQTSQELDQINFMILIGMVIFASITGILGAKIMLIPTQNEFRLRKKFITAVAHELRTPLAVLRTSNEVALYDPGDKASVEKILHENIEETKNISNIINNLVIFSRVETEESFIFEPTLIPPVLEEVIKKLARFAEMNSVQVIYTPTPLQPINANRTALEQIFYNLIKNAIIYSKPAGGTVTIDTFSDGNVVSVSFIDTGIGIPRKNFRHIFEPFFRVNPDDSQSASGTGLGLSLVLEIMKLHKGRITVESTLDKGTNFTVQFPLETAAVANKKTESGASSLSFAFDK